MIEARWWLVVGSSGGVKEESQWADVALPRAVGIIILYNNNNNYNNEEVRRCNTAAPHVLRGGILHDVGAPSFYQAQATCSSNGSVCPFVRYLELEPWIIEEVTCTSWSYDSSRLYFYLDIDLFAAVH